jgi:hypothetical protein
MEQDQPVENQVHYSARSATSCGGCADIYYRLRFGSASVRVLKLSATGGKKTERKGNLVKKIVSR